MHPKREGGGIADPYSESRDGSLHVLSISAVASPEILVRGLQTRISECAVSQMTTTLILNLALAGDCESILPTEPISCR